MKILLINILFMAMFALTHGNSEDPETKYLVINPDKVDYKFTGKKDEHRFGVEIKENKQFHHTRTEEDGVRLGCYGYVHPNGKAYSTHYVADNRGYRIVPHHGDILVYPKDGTDARKASFFESFNEDEIKSSNIRYFFPNGCKSTMIDIKLIDPSATPSPYVSPQFSSKTDDATKIVPGVATNFNQNNKNFPTKIIPIVTGTVLQNKINQIQGGKTNEGGITTTNTGAGGATSESGSGSSGNSQVISVGNDKINDNTNNVGNKNHDDGENHNAGNHNTDGDDNSSNGASHSNNDDNNKDHHTVPIYERDNTSENNSSSKTGLDNRYLPTEIEIEEPEKNEFLKIVPVTPSTPIIPTTTSTPITAVPIKPIVPVVPAVTASPTKPTVSVTPTKPATQVTPTKPTTQVTQTTPAPQVTQTKPATQVTPTKPTTQVTPTKPSKPIAPVTPSLIVPVTQITPTNPTKPSLPTPTLNPVKPVSPSKTIPINPIVPAEISNQCQDCCEDAQRPTLLMARNSETTCCKKDVAKLSIPISMDKLAKISMTELIEITSETNTITMLKKLLALAEKYQF